MSKPMKFRDDIDIASTWVVSDTHFGHDNIVGFCHRPEDHEQVMIAEWRKVVPDDATVLHLGDLCYKGNARFKNLTARELTGARKLLIMGNHDRQRYSFYKQSGFNIVRPFAIRYGADPLLGTCDCGQFDVCDACGADPGYVVSFSHYAWGAPDDEGVMPRNHWRLHGHIHNNGYTREGFVPFLRNHINLSVEQLRYTPVNLKVLLDAAIAGVYEETTQESLDEARERRDRNKEAAAS
jgi:calcineurin-like phosphoesterase family protein